MSVFSSCRKYVIQRKNFHLLVMAPHPFFLHRSLLDHQLQSDQEDDQKAARTKAPELHWRLKLIRDIKCSLVLKLQSQEGLSWIYVNIRTLENIRNMFIVVNVFNILHMALTDSAFHCICIRSPSVSESFESHMFLNVKLCLLWDSIRQLDIYLDGKCQLTAQRE